MKSWVIPPKKSAAFVADMERVLALYAEPYDPARPVVCFDERPCALVGEAREPLPMRPGAEARQDHEYTRGGLCSLMMAFEPLRAWRKVWVHPKRRRLEFAEVMRELAEEVYPEAERIGIVCDQLSTHTAAAFYERYAPEEAKRLAERIEFVHTPVHGCWPWRGGSRTERFCQAVPGPPPARADREAARRSRGVGGSAQRRRRNRRVAHDHRRRPA